MNFQTLENISMSELTDLFNTAFTDYFVKVNMTTEILLEKVYSEDIDLKFSMGIFEDEKPIGFMLHGLRDIDGNKVAYNAGTGVIKKYRGQNATVKMYEKLIPLMQEQGVSEVVLEVIEQNTPAIRSYEKAGFQKVSELACFTGVPIKTEKYPPVEIRELDQFDYKTFNRFCDWQACWQHATETIKKMDNITTLGAFWNNELVGFLTGQKSRARVYQFAVSHSFRRKRIGSALFHKFADLMKMEISAINIDDPSGQSQLFLQHIGLKPFLSQYKMKLKI